MSLTKLLLICVCYCVFVSAASGQTAQSTANPGVLGYLDPRTGAFRPVPPVAEESLDAAAALAPFGGTITLTITITLKTTSLTSITCVEEVTVFDGTTAPRIFAESNTVAATGTGTTRTCKLSIPYSWTLTTPTSDNMTTNYSVFGSTGTNGLPQRTSTLSPLDTRKVPANGVITALTAAVTL